MTSYTARIILEGGIDLTVELDAGERAQILLIAYEARDRGLEQQRIRREEELARLRRERATRVIIDEPFAAPTFADLNDLLRGFEGFKGAFSFGTTAASSGPRPTRLRATRPTTPHTTNEALAVLKHYAGDLGHGDAALRTAVRRAKRKAHPDTGGASADFHLVTAAEDLLRRAGRI